MEVFHQITEQLVGLPSLFGIDKLTLKVAFELYGLQPLWSLLRDVYLNPYVLMLGIPLWVLLGKIWPAEKHRSLSSGNLPLDFLYPIFSLPIQTTIIVSGAAFINRAFAAYIPFLDANLLDGQPVAIQAVGAFLIVDFMFYVTHWLKHKVPWLWYFHAVHHSQRHVNLFTTFRNHPFEGLINLSIKAVPIAIVGGSYPAWALFALFNSMWGYYIHANVRTNMGPLKYLIVTPQNHRLHHSIEPQHLDRNFGERLTIWDWMFGTLYKDFDVYPSSGVKGCEWIEEKRVSPISLVVAWLLQFFYPFYMIGSDIANVLSRALRRENSLGVRL